MTALRSVFYLQKNNQPLSSHPLYDAQIQDLAAGFLIKTPAEFCAFQQACDKPFSWKNYEVFMWKTQILPKLEEEKRSLLAQIDQEKELRAQYAPSLVEELSLFASSADFPHNAEEEAARAKQLRDILDRAEAPFLEHQRALSRLVHLQNSSQAQLKQEIYRANLLKAIQQESIPAIIESLHIAPLSFEDVKSDREIFLQIFELAKKKNHFKLAYLIANQLIEKIQTTSNEHRNKIFFSLFLIGEKPSFFVREILDLIDKSPIDSLFLRGALNALLDNSPKSTGMKMSHFFSTNHLVRFHQKIPLRQEVQSQLAKEIRNRFCSDTCNRIGRVAGKGISHLRSLARTFWNQSFINKITIVSSVSFWGAAIYTTLTDSSK